MPKLDYVKSNLHAYKARTNVCVFGAPKSGKSQLTAGLSEKFNLIWFDLENGWEILLKQPPENSSRITLIKLEDTKDNPVAIETVNRALIGSKGSICHAHGKWNCLLCKDPSTVDEIHLNALGPDTIVVIDTGSQLATSAMFHVTKGKPELYKLQQDDWGSIGKLLESGVSFIQQSKYHCVLIAHELETKMEDDKVRIVPSIGTTNFSARFGGKFSHIVHTEVKNGKHVAQSGSTCNQRFLTGSRTDVRMEDMGEHASLLPFFTPFLEGETGGA